MLSEALMEKVMHNEDREEAAKAYANSVFSAVDAPTSTKRNTNEGGVLQYLLRVEQPRGWNNSGVGRVERKKASDNKGTENEV